LGELAVTPVKTGWAHAGNERQISHEIKYVLTGRRFKCGVLLLVLTLNYDVSVKPGIKFYHPAFYLKALLEVEKAGRSGVLAS